jgi:dUTP diphosphatase
MLKVKIINKSNNELPKYETPGSAGLDLRANLEHPVRLFPGERRLIPTGIFIALPEGYEAQIRPRSGLAVKFGVTVLNSPGTIDADYRGEIMVNLINHGNENFVIENSMRIAQMVINKIEQISFESVTFLDETERGTGGHGSTGNK